METESDVLIIGSGIAGLRLALELSPFAKVFILTKKELLHSNTRWAQGGIAAAWEEDDDWKSHVEDTLVAGAGLCRREVVEFVAKQGKQRVQELIDLGVQFDKKENERLSVLKEEAYKQRKVKADAPVQQISEDKKEEPINPYLQELQRSHK